MYQDPARQNGKRRRLQGSCDSCRKRKVRCDSAEMPENRCTNCIVTRIECTHERLKAAEGTSPRVFAPTKTVVTAQEHVATILSPSYVYTTSQDPKATHRILVQVAQYARNLEEKLAALQPQTLVPITTSSNLTEACNPENTVSKDALDIQDALRLLTISGTDRFYGHSSSVQFTKTAIKRIRVSAPYVQRPEFWRTQPWERLTIEPPQQVFPENDLLKALIKIYFEQINPLLGILHFPSFHQSILDGLHFRDPQFGAVVLTVCALASRYSDDPRVFIEGANSEHSCGWKWYRQVRPLRATFSDVPSLYELQLICLGTIFIIGQSIPEESWILAGIGIRCAQGVGAHQRSAYSNMKPLTAELYRRVFWILVVIDTTMSTFNGRPSMTNPNDFDIDLPVDYDDWEKSDAVQPEGKPSNCASLPVYLRLMLIFGRIQRAVYPANGQMCSESVVVELDSALNEWVDTIPEHLRWNPHQENQVFLDQSATLYSTYYHAQILMHRPFIPAPGKESVKMNFPSLAICANAARSCGHVLDVQARRGRGLLHYPTLMTTLFDSAVVLLVNVWAVVGSRGPQTPEDFARATADAQNCVRVLRLYERRWRVAGRKCDIISAMLNIGKYTSHAHSLKREREVEEMSTPPDLEEFLSRPEGSTPEQMTALGHPIQETDHLFSLPLLTVELGRLPVYDPFDYEPTFQPNEFEPDPLYNVDSALDSIFSPPQVRLPGDEDIQLPSNPLDIPLGYGWRDWDAYLASVDGMNQGTF
ncbi:fungal-specific transcription factor domain-containing protein [Mycena albidolilacea]|uniref:Fungal-specific transcription factor domain-containing protein n=1 Tax=Mycena albidolilacea TaxID=1033008 RepID=A0AAD7F0Y8_9AGAR|nr:fungal-specific transcription factor domain-containing protein [Mycena albidolilacea]